MIRISLFLLFILTFSVQAKRLDLDPQENFQRLLKEMDSDGDKKITIDDVSSRQKKLFKLKLKDHQEILVDSTYHKSNLLQELKLAVDSKRSWVEDEKINENPVDRISRNIKHHYWDNLTRRINHQSLPKVLEDPKINQGKNRYLYIPENDVAAYEYFEQGLPKHVIIQKVPSKIDEHYLASLKGKHGLLVLKIDSPFVVPGGRFNEMYGWDSFFELLGLLQDNRLDLAIGMIDNMVYEIEHYGKILNANRSYYLARSQPPFLTSMVRSVLPLMPKIPNTKAWLRTTLKAAIKEYLTVWMGPDHLTPMGLSRYYGYGPEIPPEVEAGHFDETLGNRKLNEQELKDFLINDQAARESGHDTTYRWFKKGQEKCSDFVTVDLNALLYKVEMDLAFLIEREFNGKFSSLSAQEMYKKAAARKSLIKKYLWDEKGWFFDYDWVDKKQSTYISATAFYPLWAHDDQVKSSQILNHAQASRLISNLISKLEVEGGLTASDKNSVLAAGGEIGKRQWDYPNGWAPHQILAWEAMIKYGFNSDADRLIYKWLGMITKNAMNYNGTVPEKYDVVARSHAVFAEYGNVGTKFSYITQEGFGWMNASYQLGLKKLSPKKLQQLRSIH